MDVIIAEARALYKATVKAGPSHGYGQSHIWDDASPNLKELRNIIETAETCHEVMSRLEKTDMYAITIKNEKRFKLMMDWHINEYYNENGVVNEKDLALAPTPNLMKMLFYCTHIKKFLGKKQENILELGGGNGQFSAMSRKTMDVKLHADIDIAESLYMAYVCTRYRFPDAACLWVNDSISGNDTFEGVHFLFVPLGFEWAVQKKKWDLFVNTASMGEMPNTVIRYWMDFVQTRIEVKALYTFNRFLNTVSTEPTREALSWREKRMNENEASLHYDKNWDIETWEVEPPFSRCPYEDTRIARYVEIAAVRKPFIGIQNDYLLETKEEDWWYYKDANLIGAALSGQLSHDLKKSGTLFRLWNAVRLGIDLPESTAMMVEYLKFIGKPGLMFEEVPFYQALKEK